MKFFLSKMALLTKITAFHEQELRQRANQNSKMKFLNVSTSGLRGKHHPVLSNVVTTSEVRSLRPVIKCLTGDYYCFSVKAAQTPGVSGHCRICPLQGETDMVTEDIVHVITLSLVASVQGRLEKKCWKMSLKLSQPPSIPLTSS